MQQVKPQVVGASSPAAFFHTACQNSIHPGTCETSSPYDAAHARPPATNPRKTKSQYHVDFHIGTTKPNTRRKKMPREPVSLDRTPQICGALS